MVECREVHFLRQIFRERIFQCYRFHTQERCIFDITVGSQRVITSAIKSTRHIGNITLVSPTTQSSGTLIALTSHPHGVETSLVEYILADTTLDGARKLPALIRKTEVETTDNLRAVITEIHDIVGIDHTVAVDIHEADVTRNFADGAVHLRLIGSVVDFFLRLEQS